MNVRPGPANATRARKRSPVAIDGPRQCKQIATDNGFLAGGHLVFAIVQGSTFDDLRREAAEGLAALDFPGYALSRGERGRTGAGDVETGGRDHAVSSRRQTR